MAPVQLAVFWIASLVVGLSRLPGLSRTPWDWDEALFISAMRKYDVTLHHPHPPGFPIYIGLAKLVSLLGLSSFHSLQAVVFAASLAIVPAMLLLGREARLSWEVSLTAGILLAFTPDVWVYGGTALSDVPSMVLVVAASGLALAGCRDDRALLLASIVLGAAVGVRAQNLMVGAAPALIAVVYAWLHHRRWQVVTFVAVVLIICASSYGIAAFVSHGLERYLGTLRAHADYIMRVDSFHNPLRPPLGALLSIFFVHPFRAPAINIAMSLLALFGLVIAMTRLDIGMWLVVGIFAPFWLGAWLYLDYWSVGRLAVGYMPLFVFLIAEGVSAMPRTPRYGMVLLLVAAMIGWTWPALWDLHTTLSPPAAAAAWLEEHEDPLRTIVWTHGSMTPLIGAFAPQFHIMDTGNGGPPLVAGPTDVYVREGLLEDAMIFRRSRKRTAAIVRDRYFEVSIVPVNRSVTFGNGWYQQEHNGATTWRWMGNEGEIILPPFNKSGILTLSLYAPIGALKEPPAITIAINGTTVDQFAPKRSNILLRYRIGPNSRADITIITTEVITPPSDPRLLGLRLNALEWQPDL